MSATGAKSRIRSCGVSLRSMGTATSGLLLPTRSVWPSGGSFSSAAGASAPCEPARFTIENFWPRACESAGRNTRTAESVGPRAGTGLAGAPASRNRPRAGCSTAGAPLVLTLVPRFSPPLGPVPYPSSRLAGPLFRGLVRGIDAGSAMATNNGSSKRQRNLMRVPRRWPAGMASPNAFYANGSRSWRR
jgi:hypothetical protein